MAEVSVNLVTDADAFAALDAPWQRLAAQHEVVYFEHPWYAAWISAFNRGALQILVARRAGEPVGFLPLQRRPNGVLLYLGNRHTQGFGALYADAAALAALADAAAREEHLELWGLNADSDFHRALGEALRRHRRLILQERLAERPVIELRGSFDEYLAGLSRRTRKWLRRKQRKLERERGAITLRLFETPRADLGDVEEMLRLEAAGWKGRQGTAVLSIAADSAFFRSLAQRFSALGRFVVSQLRVGDRLAAFEFGVITGRRYWALKGSIDEEFGRYSPGMVLQLAVVRAGFERGLGAIELLGDNSGWKRRFANATWSSVRVYTWPRTPAGRAAYLWRAKLRPALRTAYLKLGGMQLRVAAQRLGKGRFRGH